MWKRWDLGHSKLQKTSKINTLLYLKQNETETTENIS